MRDNYSLLFAVAAVGLTVGCRRSPPGDRPIAASRVSPAPEAMAERNGHAKPGAGIEARDTE